MHNSSRNARTQTAGLANGNYPESREYYGQNTTSTAGFPRENVHFPFPPSPNTTQAHSTSSPTLGSGSAQQRMRSRQPGSGSNDYSPTHNRTPSTSTPNTGFVSQLTSLVPPSVLHFFGVRPRTRAFRSYSYSGATSHAHSLSFRPAPGSQKRWMLVTIVILLVFYAIWGRQSRYYDRPKLDVRWWDPSIITPETKPVILLPKPKMPPKPQSVLTIDKYPVPRTSKQELQLLTSKLSLDFKNIHSANTPIGSYASLIYVTHTSQLSKIPAIVSSLVSQSLPPKEFFVSIPSSMSVPRTVLLDLKKAIQQYPTYGHSILRDIDLGNVEVEALSKSLKIIRHHVNQKDDGSSIKTSSKSLQDVAFSLLSTDAIQNVLFINAEWEHLDKEETSQDYTTWMTKVSLLKQFEGWFISGAGANLKQHLYKNKPDQNVIGLQCFSSRGIIEPHPIQVPLAPFLVSTRQFITPRTDDIPPSKLEMRNHVESMVNGVRIDVPFEVGFALAIWKKFGLRGLVIPGLPSALQKGESIDSQVCDGFMHENTLASSEALEEENETLASGEIYARRVWKEVSAGFRGRSADPLTIGEEENGTVAFLVSGQDELDAIHGLACTVAQDKLVKVFVADIDDASRVSITNSKCHLDLVFFGKKSLTELSSESVRFLQDLAIPARVLFYVIDGDRASQFSEALRWFDANFGRRVSNEYRWATGFTGVNMQDKVVAIPMLKKDFAASEWIGTLPLEALKNWHKPRIDLSVVTNDRPSSLYRLLTSLQDSFYFGDDVAITINMEQTADMLTQRLADNFPWPHGHLTIRHRVILGGLLPAIVESWYPASNDTYGVFLEDDVELSPHFYAWLKYSILYYRYYSPMKERSQRLYGISLYQPRNIELRPPGRQPFDAHIMFEEMSLLPTIPYLSQIPCSWGAVYFPEVWREFHLYLALRLSETSLPISETIVPDILSNRWPRSWKKYFIELAYLRGYLMLYPNYADFVSFSTNHLEKGEHNHLEVPDEKRMRQYAVPLMPPNASILDLPEARLPVWESLPILDFWGAIATDEEILERGWQTSTQLSSCPAIRLDVAPTYNARELLCPKIYETSMALVVSEPLAAGAGGPGVGSVQRVLAEMQAEERAREMAEEAMDDQAPVNELPDPEVKHEDHIDDVDEDEDDDTENEGEEVIEPAEEVVTLEEELNHDMKGNENNDIDREKEKERLLAKERERERERQIIELFREREMERERGRDVGGVRIVGQEALQRQRERLERGTE